MLGLWLGMLLAAMLRASAEGDAVEERLARWAREDVRERARGAMGSEPICDVCSQPILGAVVIELSGTRHCVPCWALVRLGHSLTELGDLDPPRRPPTA